MYGNKVLMALPTLGAWIRRVFSHHLSLQDNWKQWKGVGVGWMNRWIGSLTSYTAPTSCRNLSPFLQSLRFLLAVLTVTVTPLCLLMLVIHAVLYIHSHPYCLKSLLDTQVFHATREKENFSGLDRKKIYFCLSLFFVVVESCWS